MLSPNKFGGNYGIILHEKMYKKYIYIYPYLPYLFNVTLNTHIFFLWPITAEISINGWMNGKLYRC